MPNFKQALERVLDHEGRVHEHDPLDKGGETYWGISRKAFPNWIGWSILANGNEPHFDIVSDLYRSSFWMPLRCVDMPSAIAEKLFDTAVNIGNAKAAKILQAVVGIKADGIIGPITLAAVNASNEQEMLTLFREIQADYYLSIVRNDPTQERFINGWLTRARS
jgi:lysozyme family protein